MTQDLISKLSRQNSKRWAEKKVLSAMETCAGHGDTIRSLCFHKLRYHDANIQVVEDSRAKQSSQEGAVSFYPESLVPFSEGATEKASGWEDTEPSGGLFLQPDANCITKKTVWHYQPPRAQSTQTVRFLNAEV